MKALVILSLFLTHFLLGDTSIVFAPINPPINIADSLLKKDIHKMSVKEIVDELSVSLFDGLKVSGPHLSFTLKIESKFNNLNYKQTALIPSKTKELLEFHKSIKRNKVKFLSALAKEQQLDFIIFLEIDNKKWKDFVYEIVNNNKDTRLEPTIVVFNNSTKSVDYAYPSILFEEYMNEEYEKINALMQSKTLEAMIKSIVKIN